MVYYFTLKIYATESHLCGLLNTLRFGHWTSYFINPLNNRGQVFNMSHLNSPSRKNNSCMHCMPMILLFVQSTVSSFYLVCCDYIEPCFLFIALFGSFVQLNLPHSSFSPPIKYFVQILHNAFLVSV